MEVNNMFLKEYLSNLEKEYILNTYSQCAANQSETARILGISRTKLIYKLKEYGILTITVK